ncbi:hypothetical protein [Marinobacter nauticus]|uniref:hypothetical protein n=1 Tax=Marinobacter nauticus TaxID=2743 RepID=UPI001C95C042|nr:hypothetical protein [Marinobacter nauticus]MBY6102296.1 hypothetical protein [Marinobacter nauticus]
MPIQEQNIKFLASQVMDDVPEGGGAATGNEIPDGVMNNVFEDISDLDRAMGRFNLRKLFLAVRTLSTDLFGGAKTVVTALPEDPAIGYTLFTTDDPFDTREQAANRVEAYLFKGPMWAGALYENHIAGMRQIRIIQRDETSTLPPRGKTLCLVQNEGEPSEIEQYIRVTEVSAEMQTFTDPQTGKDFHRLIVTLDLSDALRHDFTGHQVNVADSYNYNTGARLRDTTVADATRYFGAQRLTSAANIGDLKLKAASMFTQLVPAAQSEEPLANQSLNPELVQTIDAGEREVEIAQQAHTLARTVTAENRRLNWIETLAPVPTPNALTLSYMAQGNWYTLTDDGNGTITGSDPGFGTGTVDYVTGNVTLTTGALPDAGSQIIYTYGSRVHYEVRSGTQALNADEARVPFTLTHSPVIATSVAISWTAGGTAKSATVDAAGAISGDATGQMDEFEGTGELILTTLPDRGSDVTISYNWYEAQNAGEAVKADETVSASSPITLSAAAKPDTLRLELWLVSPAGQSRQHKITAVDQGGNLVVPKQQASTSWGSNGSDSVVTEQIIGTVSGNTVTLNENAVDVEFYLRGYGMASWYERRDTKSLSIDASKDAVARYVVDGVTTNSTAATDTTPIASVTLELTPGNIDGIVPESVRFTLGGKTYDDRAGNVLTDIDPTTGSGLDAGSIDYDAGTAIVTFWEDGQPVGFTVFSLLTVYGEWTATEGFFRTPSAPLKPESLQIIGTTEDGEQIIATANQDGELTHEWLQGTVNYTFGTAAVTFGKLVPDSSLTAEEKTEWWYDPAKVDGDGNIYKPRPMITSTLRYNAVAFSYIPLNADIVGIDAVRLPSDGRVPIYRPGDVVMVMHPQETAPQTVTNGGTIATRPRIGWIRVIDANGDQVGEGYSLDRATGTVTFDDVTGIAMPVTVRHTVADLRLVTDVQITGDITLSRPLTHDYPANESIVASCLIHGDRRARVSAVWDQQTWNGTWQDSIEGDEATATLNTIAHPITVTNEGAETERWVLRFTSSTNVELIGQRVGLVFSGPFTDDIAPINPRTRNEDGSGGVPYLTIPVAANGGGWSTGNIVRINTVGALADFWMARAIQQSDEPLDDGADGCEIHALGNIDRP